MKNVKASIVLLSIIFETAVSQIQVTFGGDTTKIWDRNVQWWCAGKFDVNATFSQDTIFIVERDTMPLATCTCYYTLCTSLVGLNPGTYHALISRQVRILLQYRDTTISTGTITFTVSNASTEALGVSLYQGHCSQVPESVTKESGGPYSYAMVSNYPNPFNPGTVIQYSVPRSGHVVLSICDMTGRQLSILVDEIKRAGTYELRYTARDLSSGIYVCRLIVGEQILSTKLVVLK